MSVLIKHIRVIDNKTGYYVPVATIVATGPNKVGVSYAMPKDRVKGTGYKNIDGVEVDYLVVEKRDAFSKKRGIEIAKGRALTDSPIQYPNRKVIQVGFLGEEYFVNLAEIMKEEVKKMMARSEVYDFSRAV